LLGSRESKVSTVTFCRVYSVLIDRNPRNRFECALPLPHDLPATRQTHYDQIIHVLTATILDLTPSYTPSPPIISPGRTSKAHIKPKSSPSSPRHLGRSTSTSTRSQPNSDVVIPVGSDELDVLRSGKSKQYEVIEKCTRVFEVVHCSTPEGDVPTFDWTHSLRLPDSGKVIVAAHSDLVGHTLF